MEELKSEIENIVEENIQKAEAIKYLENVIWKYHRKYKNFKKEMKETFDYDKYSETEDISENDSEDEDEIQEELANHSTKISNKQPEGENTNKCDQCNFIAKCGSGLKNHVTRKHKPKRKAMLQLAHVHS